MITTSSGLKPIEECTPLEEVLTHTNEFRAIVKTMKRKHSGDMYKLKVQGSPCTIATGEHPFFVRERTNVWDNDKRMYVRHFSEPKWKEAKDLTKSDFVGFAINTKSENHLKLTDEECFLLGRYVADGFIQNNKRSGRKNSYNHKVVFCIGKSKIDDFKHRINEYSYGIDEDRTVYKVRIFSERLMNLCYQCGRGAENKRIPEFAMDLHPEMLRKFIDGYMSGDGSEKDGIFSATSVSKTLIYQLGQAVNKAYGTGYRIYYFERPKTTIIEGRLVNQKDTWTIRFRKEIRRQDNYCVIDDVLWNPVKEIQVIKNWQGDVYNLEVAEDNSYIANNCTVHNCQDLSVAGRRAGFAGSRSGLFLTVMDLLKRKSERDRPEWLLFENVEGILSSNDGWDFLIAQTEMASSGYDTEYEIFNAADFGIPQNRKRLFLVGHLGIRGRRKVFPLREANGQNAAELKCVGMLDIKGQDVIKRVYSPTRISPTLTTMAGGNREPKVVINNDARGGLTVSDTVGTLRANSHGNLPMVQVSAVNDCARENKTQNGRRIKEPEEPMFTLTGQDRHGVLVTRNGYGDDAEWTERVTATCLDANYYKGLNAHQARTGVYQNARIRKLTPKECWRLMGRQDWEFERAKATGISDSQLYKQAGNSLVPQIVTAIARNFE